MAKYRIGIDLGGTKTEILLANDNPTDVIERRRVPTERDKGYDHIVRLLTDLVSETKNIVGQENEFTIGVGIPGSPSPKTGKVRNANTTHLNGRNFAKDLSDKMGQKVFVSNDANCLTLSEFIFGNGKDYDSILGIIMGTGMGGGIIKNRKLVEGHNGNGGEWGHACLGFSQFRCWCGRESCYELFLSGKGVEHHYTLRSGVEESLQNIIKKNEEGLKEATETIDEFVDRFSLIFSNLIRLFRPQAIVFGGGLSNLDIIYSRCFLETQKRSGDKSVKFLKNVFGDSSGIFGAALLPDLDNFSLPDK